MKSLLPSFLLAFCSLTNLFAQNFPLKGNESWAYNQYRTVSNPPGGCTIDSWEHYELKGDTLLDGVKWYPLYRAAYTEIYCSYPSSHSESFTVPTPKGFLRDSADVWLYRADGNAAQEILFSFGLDVGQAFFPNEACVVEQISATNTTPPRRVESQLPPAGNGLATQVVEGIGAFHSFFFPACYSCFSSECTSAVFLKCFIQDSVEVPVDLFPDCAKAATIYQKILDYQQQTPTNEAAGSVPGRLQLLPNPGSDKVHLQFPDKDPVEDWLVQVFDRTGNLILSQRFTNAPVLNTTSWIPGVYTIRAIALEHGQTGYGSWVKQ